MPSRKIQRRKDDLRAKALAQIQPFRQTGELITDTKTRISNLDALTPRTTETFQQGQRGIMKALTGQAQRDAGMAAQRGLAGSEFEIAQGANRSSAMADATGALAIQSEQMLEQRRERARQMLVQLTGMDINMRLALKDMDDRKRQARNQFLSNLFGSATSVAASYLYPPAGAAKMLTEE